MDKHEIIRLLESWDTAARHARGPLAVLAYEKVRSIRSGGATDAIAELDSLRGLTVDVLLKLKGYVGGPVGLG